MSVEKKTKGTNFASKFGFIMAAAGSAVGLGNLWGFPYKAGVGGGAAWVIVYLACVVAIGVVVMIAEMFIGQRAQKNAVSAYQEVGKKRKWGWVGFFGVLVAAVISCYYIVLGGWSLFSTVNSFTPGEFSNANFFATFADSTWLPIACTAVFMGAAVAIICGGVQKGIEKFSKIFMPTLFVLLVVVAIRSLTLEGTEGTIEGGVQKGLEFYLSPDFSKLTFGSVLSAMGQAFFSLSLGMGAMVVYGSYTKKSTNLATSALIVCGLDTLIAIIAGLAIFPAVFAFGLKPGAGPALMFFTLPQVFAGMGAIGTVFSFMFFGLIFLAALTSIMSLLEVVTQFLIENTKYSRKQVTITAGSIMVAISCAVSISLGGAGIAGRPDAFWIFGTDLLTFLDDVTNKYIMPVAAILACVSIGWIIKPKNAIAEMVQNGWKTVGLLKVWAFMVQFVTPVLVAVVLVGGGVEHFGTVSGPATLITALVIMVGVAVAYTIVNNKTNSTPTSSVEQKESK